MSVISMVLMVSVHGTQLNELLFVPSGGGNEPEIRRITSFEKIGKGGKKRRGLLQALRDNSEVVGGTLAGYHNCNNIRFVRASMQVELAPTRVRSHWTDGARDTLRYTMSWQQPVDELIC
ncbi:hypothetical protein F4679DRAFT_552857 [Xylaria curta]|nr:hypothetical protein F4679DRAFT_552857 [Xylaria curta]